MNHRDLDCILTAKADPNGVDACLTTPLENVLAYASSTEVEPMRTLLLDAGAAERDRDLQRWFLRCRTDMNANAWMRRFHSDPR